MSSPLTLHRYTHADYLSLEAGSSTKHEFLNGEIYATAGGSPLHAALAAAVVASLARQLEGSPCRVYTSDLRIRVLATGLATYPDVTVICGAVESDPADANAAVNPKLVAEVLSPGTEEYDRGEKLSHYRRVPSLDAVVLVSQSERCIEVWRREQAWVRTEARRGQVAELPLGGRLMVDRIYDAAGAA